MCRSLAQGGFFFDTETTGLPILNSVPAEVFAGNWPRLVQLSWILTDDCGTVLKEMNKYVIPEGFYIPDEAVAIHGITTAYARYWGERLERVLHVFNKSLRMADYVVCHNAWYDTNVVMGEMIREGIDCDIKSKVQICTMLSGTDLCAIEFDRYGEYKWPKLQELYFELFHRYFDSAHNAMADVRAVVDCFWEMRDRRYI